MIYPVKNWESWYSAQGFGAKTSYGFHEGEDINLKTGGDTDLGQPILAIADGIVTSVHSHTTSPTFGNHLHISHDGAWGRVWCHYAHCSEILVKEGDKVVEGQIVAKVGKTGTQYAHLHWAVKKEPTGVNGIAKTEEDLKKWIAPIEFVLEWGRKTNINMDWLKGYFIEHFKIDLTKAEGEVRALLQPLVDAYGKVEEYKKKIDDLEKSLAGKSGEIGDLEQRIQTSEQNRTKLDEEVKEKNRLITDKETLIFQLQVKLKDFEGKIPITQEEYERLSSKECLKRFTKLQILWFLIRG
jgi:murein DD-endopeptidase MepM/ murein hydrolase activator NlpD